MTNLSNRIHSQITSDFNTNFCMQLYSQFNCPCMAELHSQFQSNIWLQFKDIIDD